MAAFHKEKDVVYHKTLVGLASVPKVFLECMKLCKKGSLGFSWKSQFGTLPYKNNERKDEEYPTNKIH